jgi:hypothetical protein
MQASELMRPRFKTLEYADGEEVTVPLTRRRSSLPPAYVRPTLGYRQPPMIVDKSQLVRLMRVIRDLPTPLPSRVPRLSQLIVVARVDGQRRAARRRWLTRIVLLAAIELTALLFVRLDIGARVRGRCVSQGWCASGR